MKNIVIFGESHTRSFAYIENLIPVFMDSGKTVNLDSKNIKNVENKIRTLRSKLPGDNYIFFTFLGEPNVRYQLDNNWYIHKNTNYKDNGNINKQYLDQCIENYKKLFDDLGILSYVITPTTAYQPSIKSLKYFNQKLKEVFGDKVIDIFSNTLVDGLVKDSYKDPNFKDDPVHLNSRIVDEFFNQLILKKIISEEDKQNYNRNKDLVYANHIKHVFNKNRFGTYNMK